MSFDKKPESENYASLLKTLVVEAGVVAREMRAEASISEKADRSLVTQADLEVSGLIRERLSSFLKLDNHILIDEETTDQLPSMEETLAKDYQWVLDPIDGTAPYSAGLPFYAVSLGLMKKGTPWLGAVYLPELDELYYTDGKGNVMRQRGARGAAQARKMEATQANVFDATPILQELYVDEKEGLEFGNNSLCTGSHVFSAIQLMNSNAHGFVGCAYVWDNAAVQAMFNFLGYRTESVHTQREFVGFSTSDLRSNWLSAETMITALPENIDSLRKKIIKK